MSAKKRRRMAIEAETTPEADSQWESFARRDLQFPRKCYAYESNSCRYRGSLVLWKLLWRQNEKKAYLEQNETSFVQPNSTSADKTQPPRLVSHIFAKSIVLRLALFSRKNFTKLPQKWKLIYGAPFWVFQSPIVVRLLSLLSAPIPCLRWARTFVQLFLDSGYMSKRRLWWIVVTVQDDITLAVIRLGLRRPCIIAETLNFNLFCCSVMQALMLRRYYVVWRRIAKPFSLHVASENSAAIEWLVLELSARRCCWCGRKNRR